VSNVTRPGAAPIFASTVRPITVPDGTVIVMYGTYGPFVLTFKNRTYPEKIDLPPASARASVPWLKVRFRW